MVSATQASPIPPHTVEMANEAEVGVKNLKI